MRELIGDSARGGDLAFVRLRLDGERIVDADADGLAEPLRGLTLLEAAAVPGETLAADALANALGLRAEPDVCKRRLMQIANDKLITELHVATRHDPYTASSPSSSTVTKLRVGTIANQRAQVSSGG